jgi:hypothetical protein
LTEDDFYTIANVINRYCNSLSAGQEFIIKQMERKVLNAIDKTEADNDDIDIQTISPSSNIKSTNTQTIRSSQVKINGIVVNSGESVSI